MQSLEMNMLNINSSRRESIISGYLFVLDNNTKEITDVIFVVSLGLISVGGLVSNIINMMVFIEPDFNDGMANELFSLAISDFFVSMLELAFTSIYVANMVCTWSAVDLWALAYVPFVWAVNAAYLISCWITAMISLERCFSVVFPFTVKQIFTRRRRIALIVMIYIFHIIVFLPAFVIEKMEWVLFNGTQNIGDSFLSESPKWFYTVVFSGASNEVDMALDITAGLFLFISSQAVLFVCSVWMSVSLRRSSTVRTTKKHSENKGGFRTSQLTNQETRLIRIVLFLSVLHTVCNLPRLSLIIFYHTYTWLNLESQQNIISLVWTIMTIFSSVTCSSSFWGYYNLNFKYRKVVINKIGIHSVK